MARDGGTAWQRGELLVLRFLEKDEKKGKDNKKTKRDEDGKDPFSPRAVAQGRRETSPGRRKKTSNPLVESFSL